MYQMAGETQEVQYDIYETNLKSKNLMQVKHTTLPPLKFGPLV